MDATPESGPVFDRRQALEACGDEALRRQVTASFLGFLPGERARLAAVVAEVDAAELGRTAHRIKSTLHVVGAVVATATADALEQAVRAGAPGVAGLARQLIDDLDRLAPELAGSLEEEGGRA